MFKAEKGWEIDETQYLDNLISGNYQNAQEKRNLVITSHRVRTLSQPKIASSSVQSCRKHLISRSQIQTAKQNLQFNFAILDQILQRKRSNHLSHLSQLSFSPIKQNIMSQQNSFRKQNTKYKIVNMSNFMLNSPKTLQRSQIQLSKVLQFKKQYNIYIKVMYGNVSTNHNIKYINFQNDYLEIEFIEQIFNLIIACQSNNQLTSLDQLLNIRLIQKTCKSNYENSLRYNFDLNHNQEIKY